MILNEFISLTRDRLAKRIAPKENIVVPEKGIEASHPNGHFYSPVTDPAEMEAESDRIWPSDVIDVPGIDLNKSSHEYVLRDVFPKYINEFDYSDEGNSDELLTQFYIRNSQFSWLDARALFVLLREWRPKKIIEVGSGYSTILMHDVNMRFLNGATDVTAIEPYPRPFLEKLDGVKLIQEKVQQVSLDVFKALDAGDILFIDSSHVSKTGSDVNHLLFAVLPILRRGVRVHVHDIFLPVDYPREWVIDENRSWNEQYVLRALLMYSAKFRVLFGCMNAFLNHKELLSAAIQRPIESLYGGSSLWLEIAQ